MRALVFLAVAACGRFNFDRVGDDTAGDGGSTDGIGMDAAVPCVPVLPQPITLTGFATGSAGTAAAAFAAIPGGFAATWPDGRDGGFGDIYAATFDASGAKTSLDLRITGTADPEAMSAIAPVPGGYMVAWREPFSSARLAVVSDTGVVGASTSLHDSAADGFPPNGLFLFAVPNGVIAIASDQRSGTNAVYLSRYDDTGQKIGTDIAITPIGSDEVVLAALLHGTTIAFVTAHEYNDAILRRVDLAGTELAAAVPAGVIRGVPDAGLAWNGSEYVVVRGVVDDASLERFSPSGQSLGTHTITSADIADIAWLGDGTYGVGWRDNQELYWQRTDTTGAFTGAPFMRSGLTSGNVGTTPMPAGAIVSWTEGDIGNQSIHFMLACP